jgi:SPOR domain
MSYQFRSAEFDRRPELLGDRREGEEPPPQRFLTVAAALAVMVVFAAGLWFAYYAGTRNATPSGTSDAPLIRADRRPMMVRPAEPGGLKIPDRNMLIYDPSRRMAEHLLPLPEQPMMGPIRGAATQPSAAPPQGATQALAAASAGNAAGRPKEALASSSAATKPSATLPVAPQATKGQVRLQLGSVRSESGAHLEWRRIRAKNTDLLGGFSASAVRADLGDRGTYYRIETGPIGDLAAARICGELRQRKVGCVIVR